MKNFLLFFFGLLALAPKLLSQPGSLNKNFGNNGILFLPVSGAGAINIQLKNGSYIVGSFYQMLKVMASGVIDSSFGVNGTVTFPGDLNAGGFAEQPDGKIVVAGNNFDDDISMYRFNADGTIDKEFGENGKVQTNLGGYEFVFALAVTKDNKIVGLGLYEDFDGANSRPMIVRYNSDGTLDKQFGINGSYIHQTIWGVCNSIALQEDGKIIGGGGQHINSSKVGFMLIRYTADGMPDSTFGGDGIANGYINQANDAINAITLQPDGKILSVGIDGNSDFNFNTAFGIIRFNNNGKIDDSFGKEGTVSITFDKYCEAYSVALQQNNKIVVAGVTLPDVEKNQYDFALVRLLPDGILDSSFNKTGKEVTDLGADDAARSVFIQKDGKILVIGDVFEIKTRIENVGLARYLGDPINLITKATIKRWIKNHILNWQATVSNNDISYYAIERSQSGTAGFTQIGKVKASKVQPSAATATYAYNLASNAAANSTTTNYYRIRAVNTDGSFVYSDVVSDAGLQTGSGFTVSPNPARDVIKVSGLPANQKTVVNIVNRNGNVLQTVTAQSSAININIQSLHSGLYSLNTIINGKAQSVQFIKE